MRGHGPLPHYWQGWRVHYLQGEPIRWQYQAWRYGLRLCAESRAALAAKIEAREEIIRAPRPS